MKQLTPKKYRFQTHSAKRKGTKLLDQDCNSKFLVIFINKKWVETRLSMNFIQYSKTTSPLAGMLPFSLYLLWLCL